jgi:hypothetical protein
MMNDKKEEQKEKPICGGGVHCLKLADKEHSTQFIHLNPVNFFLFLLICLFFILFFVDKLTIDQSIYFHLNSTKQHREILKKVLNNVKFQRIQHSLSNWT